MTDTILIADNEPDILRFIEVNLRLEGFDVLLARDGAQALEAAVDALPSLVLLDVMMPGLDGLEVCRRLRANARTSHIPVIILTAKSMTVDKVVGLTAGADDYVVKPFDPMELVARVKTTLRRNRELRTTSPLTGLPGNHRIEAELARRIASGYDLALVYADLNEFKAYNDYYGFLRGDQVIEATANVLCEVVEAEGGSEAFAGHIGGDDFMFLCPPERVSAVCRAVIARFDSVIPSYYDAVDAKRGYIEVADRRGERQRFPLVTISLGVATTERRTFATHHELVEVATEMKTYLKKSRRGSAYAVDGRSDPEDGGTDRP